MRQRNVEPPHPGAEEAVATVVRLRAETYRARSTIHAEDQVGLDVAVNVLRLDVTPREVSAQRRALVEAIAELVWNDAERPPAKP